MADFFSFNYWHPVRKVWVAVIYSGNEISRCEPDPDNPTLTRIWFTGKDYPGLLTDMTWATAATRLSAPPPADPPANPPVGA